MAPVRVAGAISARGHVDLDGVPPSWAPGPATEGATMKYLMLVC
jgi:hypothetical protein